MDVSQHFAAAEALLAQGAESGSWQYWGVLAQVAGAHLDAAGLILQAQAQGVELGAHEELITPQPEQEA
jgi:hypothetical protein